jgi:hypothetical protein
MAATSASRDRYAERVRPTGIPYFLEHKLLVTASTNTVHMKKSAVYLGGGKLGYITLVDACMLCVPDCEASHCLLLIPV